MKICGISHVGNSRANQEDSFLVGDKYLDLNTMKKISEVSQASSAVYFNSETDTSGTLLAVSDGMGGHSSGEVASSLSVKYLAERYLRIIAGGKDELLRAITELNQGVLKVSREHAEYHGMGATLCGFLFRERNFFGFNIGDSRLYRYSGGVLLQLSKDHTEGQRLVDLNLLTEEELGTFPRRKAIYKCIGLHSDLVADVFDILPPEKGTIFLLCTDGLTDALTDKEIREILACDVSLKEKSEELLRLALGRNLGRGDNITILLAEF